MPAWSFATRSVFQFCRDCLAKLLALVAVCISAYSASDALAQQSQQDSAKPLEVTYLANEGFLIKKDRHHVLIDAFIKDSYYGYAAIPANRYDALVRGQSPFDGVRVALTTHVHLDHFQHETAGEFLKHNSSCKLIASEQVVLKMRQSSGGTDLGKQLVSLWPEVGKKQIWEDPGIKITAMRFPHSGGGRHASIQNLGFLMQIGDSTVLHLGDADMQARHFKPYQLAEQNIDVAILPVWFFRSPKFIEAQIAAKKLIAAHLIEGQAQEIADSFASKHPQVFVPTQAMQSWKQGQ